MPHQNKANVGDSDGTIWCRSLGSHFLQKVLPVLVTFMSSPIQTPIFRLCCFRSLLLLQKPPYHVYFIIYLPSFFNQDYVSHKLKKRVKGCCLLCHLPETFAEDWPYFLIRCLLGFSNGFVCGMVVINRCTFFTDYPVCLNLLWHF